MLRPVLAVRRDLSQRKDHQVHETTSVGRGPQRRLGFWRPGVFLAAIGAATLLAAGCSAAFASSSPAPVHGHIYWTNGHWIGRARLSGTDVRQRFITGGNFPEAGLTLDSRYLYWANGGNGTIGRARLNGTGVNQRFIITKPSTRQIGMFGAAVAPGW
jgi:hypothetical protein